MKFILWSAAVGSFALILAIIAVPTPAMASAGDGGNLAELGFCETKISQIKGIMGPICRRLVDSTDFRSACAKIPKENRIKCDGTDMSPKPGNTDVLRRCIPHMVTGTGASIKEMGEFALWIAQTAAKPALWAFGIGDAQATASAQETPLSTATSRTGAHKNLSAPSVSTLTDDTSAYTVHTATDETERMSWFQLVLNKDFWTVFAEETKLWMSAEVDGFLCLDTKLQDEAVCKLIGGIAGPGALFKIAKLIKAGVKSGEIRRALSAGFTQAKATSAKLRTRGPARSTKADESER